MKRPAPESAPVQDRPVAGDPGLSYIEHLTAPQLPECETPGVPVLVGVNEDMRIAVIWRPRCKKWACPVCANINKRAWAYVAGYGAGRFQMAGKVPRFVTLTSHERLDPDFTLRVFPKAWHKLHARMRRRWPGVQYLMVPERHTDGRLHVHGVVSEPVSTRWLKDNARACGLGYIADSQAVRSIEKVISYIAKHIAKQLEDQAWPDNFRRVRTSQAWPRPGPVMPGVEFDWQVCESETDVFIEAEALRSLGYTVIEGGHRTAWAKWEALRPAIILRNSWPTSAGRDYSDPLTSTNSSRYPSVASVT